MRVRPAPRLVTRLSGGRIGVRPHPRLGIDRVANRALVYGSLAAIAVAVYLGTAAGVGALQGAPGLGISLLAAGAVAAVVILLRPGLQRLADRLVYGDRDDPYRALTQLAERLGAALELDAVMPAIVEAVAEGLGLPYVAIELPDVDGHRVAVGNRERRGGEPVQLPLEYQGEVVGRLVVASHPGQQIRAADLRLLADLARQAGVAVHAVRLTHDLRRSRQSLVAAREEERRRLRYELHDGLGPALAGIALELESARAVAGADPATARERLAGAKDGIQAAIGEVRRIARELGPAGGE